MDSSLIRKNFLVYNLLISSWVHRISGTVITQEFNNPKNFEGWSCGKVQKCGSFGNICGGANVKGKGSNIQKTFMLPAGKYSVKLDFLEIDTWFVWWFFVLVVMCG